MDAMQDNVRLSDLFGEKYGEFVDFCTREGLRFVGEVQENTYAKFKEEVSCSNEMLLKIRETVENGRSNKKPFAKTYYAGHRGLYSSNDQERADLKRPLGELLEIPENSPLYDLPISALGLSTRAYNCVRDRCPTVRSLMSRTLNQISRMEGCGKRTAEEILTKCRELAREEQPLAGPEYSGGNIPEILRLASAIAAGETLEWSSPVAVRLQEAATAIGGEICQMAIRREPEILRLLEALEQYSDTQEFRKDVERKLQRIFEANTITEAWHVLPFVEAVGRSARTMLSRWITEETLFRDLPKVLLMMRAEKTQSGKIALQNVLDILDKMQTGLEPVLREGREFAGGSETIAPVLRMLLAGCPDEEIKESEALTSRQLGSMKRTIAWRYRRGTGKAGLDILDYLYALLDGQPFTEVATKKCVADEESAEVMWVCITLHALDNERFAYSEKESRVISFRETPGITEPKLIRTIGALPKGMPEDEAEKWIRECAKHQGYRLSDVQEAFLKQYRLYGRTYIRGQINETIVCEYILEHCYPDGFQIEDQVSYLGFKYQTRLHFGEKYVRFSPHILNKKIKQVGIQCDAFRYIHPNNIRLNRELLRNIDQYIALCDRERISYEEIFRTFEPQFLANGIKNSIVLRSALELLDGREQAATYLIYPNYVKKIL